MGAQCFVLCALLVGYGYGSPVVYDTIVVGLGASGAAAASTLAKAGKKVLALEAQDRIGGRVHTVPFGDGLVELGAEWIEMHGTELSSNYELAIKNNISLQEPNNSMNVYFSDGTTDRADIVLDIAKYATDLIHKPPSVLEPLGAYITRRVRDYINTKYPSVAKDNEFVQDVLEFLGVLVIIMHDSANNWNEVMTNRRSESVSSLSWHNYGYNTLFEIMLNTYKNGPGYPTLEIKLNTEVTRILWPQNPKENVEVTVKDGTTYTAKNVIVTVSLGVLQEKHESLFYPAVPVSKYRAFITLSMGVCDKLTLRFEQPWWPLNSVNLLFWKAKDKARVSEEDRWLLKMNTPSTLMSSNDSLIIWSCGDTAKKVESLPEEVLKTKVMGLLRKFMGNGRTIPEPIEMIKSSWYSNPFTRGSYSYDNLYTPVFITSREALARPLDDFKGNLRVLFAGEATETNKFGTVHGAIDSGRREANRILSAGN